MNRLARVILILLAVAALAYLWWTFSTIVNYILMGWVLSLIGRPLEKRLSTVNIGKWQLPRSISAAITLMIMLSVLTFFVMMIFPQVLNQAQQLSRIEATSVAETLSGPIEKVELFLVRNGLVKNDISLEQELLGHLRSIFNPSVFVKYLQGVIGTASNLFIGLFSVLFISFFFLKDADLFAQLITAIVPDKWESQVIQSIDQSSVRLRQYFSGLVVQLTLFMLIILISLWLFGFKSAILIAFTAAVLNVIPYLGPLLGAIFGILITISANVGTDFYTDIFPQLTILVIIFMVVQQIDGFFIQPFVFSNSVQAHPLEIFLIILAGGQVAGIPGMVLAIPAYTVLRVIGRIFFTQYKVIRRLTADRA